MAIAYSAPAYERRSRRTRRESTALSTNINTQVAFGDLSLSSQLLYAAMVETWSVVQEIAGEEAFVIFEKDENEKFEEQSVTVEDGGMSTGFLAEDFLTELDNMETEENEDLEEINIDIIGGYEISKFADENNNKDDVSESVPDLVAGSVETKLSACLPDLVASCLPAGGTNDQSHPKNTNLRQNTGMRGKNSPPRQNTKQKQNTLQKQKTLQKHNHGLTHNLHPLPTDTTDCTQRGERSRVLHLQRHEDTEWLSKKCLEEKSWRQGEETKSSWAETGRQLGRIADAEERRRRIESDRPSSAQSSDLYGRSIISSLLPEEEDLDPIIEKYSDVLSAIALAGISYLVRRMLN